MDCNGYFRTIHIKDESKQELEILKENWQNSIFFDNEADAKNFLIKLKDFILKEYPRSKNQDWFK